MCDVGAVDEQDHEDEIDYARDCCGRRYGDIGDYAACARVNVNAKERVRTCESVQNGTECSRKASCDCMSVMTQRSGLSAVNCNAKGASDTHHRKTDDEACVAAVVDTDCECMDCDYIDVMMMPSALALADMW